MRAVLLGGGATRRRALVAGALVVVVAAAIGVLAGLANRTDDRSTQLAGSRSSGVVPAPIVVDQDFRGMTKAELAAFKQLRLALPDNAWGGVDWLRHEGLVVWATAATPTQPLGMAVDRARATGVSVQVRQGDYSLAALNSQLDHCSRSLPEGVARHTTGWSVDSVRNRLRVGMERASTADRLVVAQVCGPAAEVVVEPKHIFY